MVARLFCIACLTFENHEAVIDFFNYCLMIDLNFFQLFQTSNAKKNSIPNTTGCLCQRGRRLAALDPPAAAA